MYHAQRLRDLIGRVATLPGPIHATGMLWGLGACERTASGAPAVFTCKVWEFAVSGGCKLRGCMPWMNVFSNCFVLGLLLGWPPAKHIYQVFVESCRTSLPLVLVALAMFMFVLFWAMSMPI